MEGVRLDYLETDTEQEGEGKNDFHQRLVILGGSIVKDKSRDRRTLQRTSEETITDQGLKHSKRKESI